MKTIHDKDFKYTTSVATDIRPRLIAAGMKPRELGYDELERLRRFKRKIEAMASFVNGSVFFDEAVFEELLAAADGAINDH